MTNHQHPTTSSFGKACMLNVAGSKASHSARWGIRQNRSGFTLLETVFTVLIVAVAGISIIAGTMFAMRQQSWAREWNAASRVAAGVLENAKRKTYPDLAPATTAVVLRVPTSSKTAGTIPATARIAYYLPGQSAELTTVTAVGKAMIEARATVTWKSALRTLRPSSLVLVTYFTP